MTRIEETELINIRFRKDLSSLNEQLSCRDDLIQKQKIAYESLKDALETIQTQLFDRANNDSQNSRNAVRTDLISNNVFSDMSIHNEQILSALDEIEDCFSSFNQKQCLKLLRDVANAAKALVLLFDRVLQVSQSLNLGDLLDEGEKMKSSYISALSSVLISGKDFSARPEYCEDFKSNVENFRSTNGYLFNLKIQIESAFQDC